MIRSNENKQKGSTHFQIDEHRLGIVVLREGHVRAQLGDVCDADNHWRRCRSRNVIIDKEKDLFDKEWYHANH